MNGFPLLHRTCLLVLLGGLSAGAVEAATEPFYSILHSFQGRESNPEAPLTSDERGNLYGTTYSGGGSDRGTVFTVRPDGTQFRRLHTFTSVDDGWSPMASLILDDSGNLFGTTFEGGSSGGGTLFTIRVDGGGFQVLHSFAAGGATDGSYPSGALTLDGSEILYGTTSSGGASSFGTVFRLRTDGTGFQILHSFAGGPSDGRYPLGSLVPDGSGNLYGTTAAGGHPPSHDPFGYLHDGDGTVFRIKTDGTDYQVLRAFPLDTNDAARLSGPLIADASGILFGMSVAGGPSRGGTVYRIGMDGSGFQLLHSFGGGVSDYRNPVGSLALDRSGNLYGMTGAGGESGYGSAVFRIRTDASGYQLLHTFDGDWSDGGEPLGSLVLDGSSETLYGAMTAGGPSNSGTIFSIDTDGSLFQVVYTFRGFMNDGSGPMASVVADGLGYLYGTTPEGGPSDAGTVFRIRSDGAGFELLHTFEGYWSSGAGPQAPLILDRAGNLYGTTYGGGPANAGTVFKIKTDGTAFQVLHSFLDGSDGFRPTEALVLDGAGNLYGTADGGPGGWGTIFRIKTDGAGYQILHSFSIDSLDSEGGVPSSPLFLDGAGNLIGTTGYGGPGGQGTVFRMRTDGTGFQLLHSFTGDFDDGANPGPVVTDGSGTLYGTTGRGGSSDAGTIFKMKTDGTGFQVVHSFEQAYLGFEADATVILDGLGSLYGRTSNGGPSDFGTLFTVKTDGTGFEVLHTFGDEPGDGQVPEGSLFLDRLGTLIGTTGWGGAGGYGTVFALSMGRHRAVAAPGPPVPLRRR